MEKVSVLGLGYVGLPLACAIAKSGKYNVVGYDLSEEKIQLIRKKISPIDDALTRQDLKVVKISVDNDPSILESSDIFIITVPTPVNDSYKPDMKPVMMAAELISRFLEKDKNQLVILESTVNPGVCEEIILPLIERRTKLKGGIDFQLAHCPERINPGDKKWSVYNIARNVGSLTKVGTKRTANFYRSFLHAKVNEMGNIKEAEATKIIENTFRDINIAYVNELAQSFDAMGINLRNVIKGSSNKPFGFLPHYPGCGVGGHCIAVDPYYLIERAKKSGFNHRFLKTARLVNNSMPKYTVSLLEKFIMENEGKNMAGAKVALLGLAYKGNISDIRESPALEMEKILKSKQVDLEIFDPYVPQLSSCSSLEDAIKKSNYLIVATAHAEFLRLNEMKLDGIRALVDGRNFLDSKRIMNRGIYYKGIGC